ncbi:DHH family phosphoesterase [Edwardsiella piscicida]|uniref:inorganic diphosphatase n=3 Tax=Edwardsiella TaxID=635 RepID=A0A0H3DU89_EDWTF|nr:DHHA2 domain-containing protein [Edwardsiella piscicida]ACY85158.1 manganese-dependent inorganic pyrophosphatase [Edwardsiella tarda EIB202]ADM42202.1 Manganese-dependent inorganic pyrophosphatase [Edwardsiella tarda FL6-60]AGH74315.1 Manganese-dependent inorganic pyrophosphatase [Edwardsiella piscicida C07-087]AOP43526.1 DHH family phosphoesterase [Edwardsiella piscicida]ARD19420.1 inorganic pyrophosphatase [Edwardsiella piscicida]
MIYVFGHKYPDSDSICSALVTAQWLTARGLPATAWRLGEINHETAYILQQAGCDAPAPLTEPLDGRDVWLVDFSDAEQGPAGLTACRLLGLIDHHRLGSLTSADPIDAWIRRVGSTATLLWQIMTQEYAMVPDRRQSTLLLGAILSDTVGLISATTTEADRRAVAALIPLSDLDDKTFLDGLLAAKTCLDGYTPEGLLEKDLKRFVVGAYTLEVAQLEVASPTQLSDQLAPLLACMRQRCREQALDYVMLAVSDIRRRHTDLYRVARDGTSLPVQALPGMLSRKKEILPWIGAHLM